MSNPATIDPAAYADWKAPSRDGELLVWPEPSVLLQQTHENHARLSHVQSARLLGRPLNELRAAARAWIGHLESDQPLIATGHQTELYHPGVWAKNTVIHAAAAKCGGAAYHIAVDTDTPKHLMMRWPGESAPITDDPRAPSAAWSALLDAPSPAHLSGLRERLRAAATAWDFTPVAFEVLDSLQRLSLEQPRLSIAICNALHELDWSLGLRHHAMVFSPISSSPPFLHFAAHLIANARQFATQYNAALHEYRDEHGMKTDSRPMPDLFFGEQAIELPFWLDDLAAGKRSRPSVFEIGGKTVLKLVGGDEFAVGADEDGEAAALRLGRFLAGTSHRLSPRALTLTMFLRLFVADQFIHGIGGGRYDQVLDKLITSHFGIAPPKFAVATATMLFPTAVGKERACVPCIVQEGRRLRHGVLGEQKRRYLDRINELPRRSRQRAAAYSELQSTLRQTWSASPALTDWERRLESTRLAEQRENVEFDREGFYAMQSRDRLAEMIERVQARFA